MGSVTNDLKLGCIKINIDDAVRKYGNLDINNSGGKDIVLFRTVKVLDGYNLEVSIKMDFDLEKIKEVSE
jgi:hypothetical protein